MLMGSGPPVRQARSKFPQSSFVLRIGHRSLLNILNGGTPARPCVFLSCAPPTFADGIEPALCGMASP